ncbi:hypothetical protein HMPREF1551_00891 [Capnocytophaga sp. oral taxon 863 str. F0517]|nr:hypothetical protein HMPREF1551_00891 [Capnocytophaga sp. oral taxon 863 str. F0517]
MEAEPVPRHLARHMLEVNANSMDLFVARELYSNHLTDFNHVIVDQETKNLKTLQIQNSRNDLKKL